MRIFRHSTRLGSDVRRDALAFCIQCDSLVAVLERKIYIFDINSMKILETLDTSPNPTALCVLSPHDNGHLAFPSGATPGEIVLYDANNLSVLNAFQAHRSAPVAMAFNAQGTLLATASETVRPHALAGSVAMQEILRRTDRPSDRVPWTLAGAGHDHSRLWRPRWEEEGVVPARVVRCADLLPRVQRALDDPLRLERHGHDPLLLAHGRGDVCDWELWALYATRDDARSRWEHVWLDCVRRQCE